MDYEFLLNISNESYSFLHVPLVGTISFCDSNISTTVGPSSLEGIKVSFKFANSYNDVININLNSATIDWDQPCGISTIWIYRFLENLDDPGMLALNKLSEAF